MSNTPPQIPGSLRQVIHPSTGFLLPPQHTWLVLPLLELSPQPAPLSPLCMLMHISCQVSSATPSPTLPLNLSCVKNTTMIFSLTLYLLSVSRFFFQMTRFLRVEIGHRESLGVRARGSISSLSQKFQLQVSVLVTWG